ncbi:MAG TPA: hypothetical protein VN830_10380 [Verrucomicrobiae bacterium]|nr:hypothetical protein [Verrucomicrobiae bacterium]
MTARSIAALFFVLMMAWCAPLRADTSGQQATTAPGSAQPNVPPDPLGRDNPHGCIIGFIKAAQEERYDVAVQYFQPVAGRHRPVPDEEEELALQLLRILNQKFAGPLDFVSRDPLGRLDDGLPADQEKINGPLGTTDNLPILLVRREDEQGRKLWYISRETLAQVPKVYDSLSFPELEKEIPANLVEHRFLYMPLWQWLAILIFVPIAVVAARILAKCAELLRYLWRRSRKLPPLAQEPWMRPGPGTLALAVIIHYLLVGYIGTSLLYRLY